MQGSSEVYRMVSLLAAAAFLLVGLAATVYSERAWRKGFDGEMIFPHQPDRDDRIARRRSLYDAVKYRWKLAIVLEIASTGFGGFLLVVSLLGPNLIFGFAGSLLFLFFAGMENVYSRNRLPDECPDPLERAESRLESIVSRDSSAGTINELKTCILNTIRIHNLTAEQTRYLLAYLSRRTDPVGDVARSMSAQRH